jgi:ABC-type Fe3+/spermidine/putrescine transport system ATPase subunit
VQLTGYERRRPRQLSGGQQQRVAIARALVNEPAVLLLDEPLGALDLRLRLQLQQGLKTIQRSSGTTFVYVTHDQTEALTMSNRVAIMHDGQIDQIDTPERIYQHPATRFAATFVGETNLFEGTYRDGKLDTGDLVFAIARPGQTVSVRPELMHLAERLEPTMPNLFAGRVEDVVFLGPLVRYRVRLDGGRMVTVERQSQGSLSANQGSTVQVGWDVEADRTQAN